MKSTQLKLTDQEREFLKKIGEGSIVEGVRQALMLCGFKEKREEKEINKATKRILNRIIKKK